MPLAVLHVLIMKVKNQTVLITGAGSGMGAATAHYLAQAGAKVALLDVNFAAAQAIAATIDGLPVACDVVDEHSVRTALGVVEKALGVPRVAINCAGIAPAAKILSREGTVMPLSDFKKVIDINLIGSFNVMRLLVERMVQSLPVIAGERGIIIHTASIAAEEGQIGQVAYSASKGAVMAMTLPAARELAQHAIRVMTIAPGLINTPMFTGFSDKVKEGLLANVPFPKRMGAPEEYAQLVLSIIENPYLNGSTIRIDGALRM